eukprot:9592904-Lingulodinium_polyedra.AAC.1
MEGASGTGGGLPWFCLPVVAERARRTSRRWRRAMRLFRNQNQGRTVTEHRGPEILAQGDAGRGSEYRGRAVVSEQHAALAWIIRLERLARAV